MTDALAHRGPDGEGHWVDGDGGIALGHRRLSIIDLSSAGAQPMRSASSRFTVVFNGEIYGYKELRADLSSRGSVFRSDSDTEVLLEAIETFGFENALRRLTGMFAFALYDARERRIYLARDRLGKKPLYIGFADGCLAFASELKSIRMHPAFASPALNPSAIALYARHNYVPGPYTIYDGVLKLRPGCWFSMRVDERPPAAADASTLFHPFWTLFDAARQGARTTVRNEDQALGIIGAALTQAVRERLVSDVPVGAFLSGGVDSSLIAAIMQEVSPTPINTYTIRFDEKDLNEADIAAEIAQRLGTRHTELTATPEMALSTIDRLPEIYDEPFADSSQIPTLLVSELARENVTVALSGDGGDEIFAGYKRYLQMLDFQRLARHTPRLAFRLVEAAPLQLLDWSLRLGRGFIPSAYRSDASADRLKKLAEVLACSGSRRYLQSISQWQVPSEIVLDAEEAPTELSAGNVPEELGELERMMYLDTVSYLPDDILVKVDRASMSVGLEMRAPLLDHRVVEAAWRAPRSLRLSQRTGKVALRRLLEKRLPTELFSRRKRGFGVPLNSWLRGPLRGWAADLISPARLRRDGIFNARLVEQRLIEHQSGTRNWGEHLWTILMFNAWHERWMGSGRHEVPQSPRAWAVNG